MKKIAICWIGIGDYNIFFEEMYKSFNEKFCNDLQKTFFIFTDKPQLYTNIQNSIIYNISNACQHKAFILFRKWKYCLMAEDKYYDYDYVAFVNGNMVCKEIVKSEEVIQNNKPLAVITHPCNVWTYKNTYNCDSKSAASFCPEFDWQYKQAGFNVSTSTEFLKMANTIESWRHLDKASGNDKYVPWHDETYFNKYCYLNKDKLNVLDGKIYAFPEDAHGLEIEFNKCKIYTRNKYQIFTSNNLKFISSTSQDLYNVEQNQARSIIKNNAVIYCIDNNKQQIEYAINSILSLNKYNYIDIFVITYKNNNFLSEYIKLYSLNIKLIFIEDCIIQEYYFNNKLSKEYNSSTLWKLFIPLIDELKIYSNILYLDNDTKVVGHIDDIFIFKTTKFLKMCKTIVSAGLREKYAINGEMDWYNDVIKYNYSNIDQQKYQVNIKNINDSYYNAGVIVFSNNNIIDNYQILLNEGLDINCKIRLRYLDQDILSFIFSEFIEQMSYRYNYAPTIVPTLNGNEYYNSDKKYIIHYYGDYKSILKEIMIQEGFKFI